VTPLEVLHLAHSRTGTLSKLKTRAVDLLQRTSS
jgi:hypothetical protein